MLLKVTTCNFRKLKLFASVGLRPQLSALKGVESEVLLRQGYARLTSTNKSELRSTYIERKSYGRGQDSSVKFEIWNDV